MNGAPFFVVDFDSTFTTVEALDLLGEIALPAGPEGDAVRAEIRTLTDQAMNGEIGFGEALRRRIELLQLDRGHLAILVENLRGRVSPSIRRNRAFFERHAGRVLIVTGGFHDYVDPIVAEHGIDPSHVLANRLVFDGDRVVGVDETNPLSRDGGKVEAVKALSLDGEVVVVGDGWTPTMRSARPGRPTGSTPSWRPPRATASPPPPTTWRAPSTRCCTTRAWPGAGPIRAVA